MAYRLLGLAAHPDQAGDLCGQAFGRYAALGTDITLVCAAARDCSAAASKPAARRLGVRDLVLLDFGLSELTARTLKDFLMQDSQESQGEVTHGESTAPCDEIIIGQTACCDHGTDKFASSFLSDVVVRVEYK